MADYHDTRMETGDQTAQLEQLRARIKELENDVQSRSATPRDGRPAATARGWAKFLMFTLAATTALMVTPALITVRRWVRWWR